MEQYGDAQIVSQVDNNGKYQPHNKCIAHLIKVHMQECK